MITSTNKVLQAAAIVFAIATSSAAIAQTTPVAHTGTASTAAASSAKTATAATTATTGAAASNAVSSSAATTAAAAASTVQKPVGLTRAQVREQFLEARANGTLLETEADFDVAQTRKHFAH